MLRVVDNNKPQTTHRQSSRTAIPRRDRGSVELDILHVPWLERQKRKPFLHPIAN